MAKQLENLYVQKSLDALKLVFSEYHPRQFNVRFWDGSIWGSETKSSEFTLVINNASTVRKMFLPPNDLALGEAYIQGYFDIEGRLEDVFPVGYKLLKDPIALGKKLHIALKLFKLPKASALEDDFDKLNSANSKQRSPAKLSGKQRSMTRDKQAISYHYDVSNDFYKLWLDKRMVYSCGYFKTAQDSLDTVQENKLEHLCKKLRLKKGEKLLDIGCGWGGMIIYASNNYGVDSTGVTLSKYQGELANQRIKNANLENRCRALVRDYRSLNPNENQFDKIVSVGMVEHVGLAQLPTYFSSVYKLLKPGGIFVNHGITRSAWVKVPKGPNFIHSYVFPDGELMPINVRMGCAECAGFEVRDTEDLREHYAKTLRYWVQRLHEQRSEALKYVSEATYRVWELYMSGSAHNFAAGNLNIYQTVLSKMDETGNSYIPLTRQDLYC